MSSRGAGIVVASALTFALGGGCAALSGLADLQKNDCVDGCADGSTPDGGTGGDAAGDGALVDASHGDDERQSERDAAGDVDRGDAATDAACYSCGTSCGATCAGCASGDLICDSTRTCGNCSACSGAPTPCYSCAFLNAPTGYCVSSPSACAISSASCKCVMASDCPGTTQVCLNDRCAPCGASGSDGLACKSGRSCFAADGRCQ